MHMRDFKKKQSGFIHGFRYNIAILQRIFEKKYYGRDLPSHTLNLSSQDFVDTIIQRINLSSALWQQTGFIGDAIAIDSDNCNARYYPEITVDYVHNSEISQCDRYYTITLDFGLDVFNASPDPFAIDRVHKDNINAAEQSAFIHPIIRCFSKGELVAEHHIIEDIAGEWLEEVHIQPLLEFFKQQLNEFSLPSCFLNGKPLPNRQVLLVK
jgi:hypothetical protein